MQISEKMDSNISLLTRSLELWNDINKMANDIECWSAISVSELSEGTARLLSTHNMEEHLTDFKVRSDPNSAKIRYLVGFAKKSCLVIIAKCVSVYVAGVGY